MSKIPTNFRTISYIRALTRKNGLSVAEMYDVVNKVMDSGKVGDRRGDSYTPHNSYSLALLAKTYGYDFKTLTIDGTRRFFFRSEKNAATFDAMQDERPAAIRAKAEEAKQAAKVAKKALKASQPVAKGKGKDKAMRASEALADAMIAEMNAEKSVKH